MYHISNVPVPETQGPCVTQRCCSPQWSRCHGATVRKQRKKKAQRTPNQGTRGMVKVTKSSLSCPDMARWVWFFLESIIHFLVINFGFANILVAKNYLPPRCTEVPPVLFGGGPSRFQTNHWCGKFRWFTRFQIQFPGRCSQHSQVQWMKLFSVSFF